MVATRETTCGEGRKGASLWPESQRAPGTPLPSLQLLLLVTVALNPAPNVDDR